MLCFEFVDFSMLCFSVLDVMCAQGVCNHGDTTNNDAEIANRMLHKMRESDDMFSSLTNFVTYERARVVSLMTEVEKVKEKTGAKLGEPWPSACAVPFVEDCNQKLRVAASTLPVPTAIGQQQSLGHASEFMVESASGGALAGSSAGGTGFRWRVKLNAIQEEDYEAACECGRVATTKVTCKHFKRGLMACQADWRDKVKPWQTVESWEKQQGRLWDPLTAQEILDATNELHAAGKLKNLSMPSLEIRNKGRPKDEKNMSVESSKRAKSFMEELKDFGDPSVAVKEVIAGSSGKNRGGKGIAKSCSLCRRLGK